MTVRWGIVGTAKIAASALVTAIGAAPNAALAAVASRSAASAAAFAADHGIAIAYDSYEALLADSEVDAVYVPLPNHLHGPITMAAADAGKHVLCEKPLALDAAQAREIVAHCDSKGVKLMEGFMYRFHPAWLTTKQLIDTGRIGNVRAIQSWFSYLSTDRDDIRHVPEWGGGALFDIGCYPISVTRWLLGDEPETVAARSLIHPDYGVDFTTAAVLGFGDAVASFTCSMGVAGDQRVDIYGDEGALSIDVPFNPRRNAVNRVRLTSTAGGHGTENELIETGPADQYALMVEAFSDSVIHDTPVPTSPDDAIANMSLLDRVRAAAGW